MSTTRPVPDDQDRHKIPSGKVFDLPNTPTNADASLSAWAERYLDLAVRGVRSDEVTGKIARHLERCRDHEAFDGLSHRLEATIATHRPVSAGCLGDIQLIRRRAGGILGA